LSAGKKYIDFWTGLLLCDGKSILEAIKALNPEIYIELHSYSRENLEKLAGRTG
jgi:hypothetical protein